MKRGNVYRHYKGGLYTYIGMALPISGLPEGFKATHSETGEEVNIGRWSLNTFITALDHPVVLYKCTKDGKLWARPVDMFFGWVMEDGYPSIQRFKLVEPQ